MNEFYFGRFKNRVIEIRKVALIPLIFNYLNLNPSKSSNFYLDSVTLEMAKVKFYEFTCSSKSVRSGQTVLSGPGISYQKISYLGNNVSMFFYNLCKLFVIFL